MTHELFTTSRAEHRPAETQNPAAPNPSPAPDWQSVEVMGVPYRWQKVADGGDLYLSPPGRAWAEHLQPGLWHSPYWFMAHRQRLLGTSTICRLETQPVRGRSLSIVVRYNRIGQRVPLDTDTQCRHVNADFNSPFEEFARLLALRQRGIIRTKRPLAIYSPPERLALWQTGREESRFFARAARHPELPLDIERQYILLYSWIDGLDAEQAADSLQLSGSARARFLHELTLRVETDLRRAGFQVLDFKPAHIIVRPRPPSFLLLDRTHQPAYALVDYELLEPL